MSNPEATEAISEQHEKGTNLKRETHTHLGDTRVCL